MTNEKEKTSNPVVFLQQEDGLFHKMSYPEGERPSKTNMVLEGVYRERVVDLTGKTEEELLKQEQELDELELCFFEGKFIFLNMFQIPRYS